MPRGRPKKYGEYEALLKSLPKQMKKRPHYLKGIGIFRGARGDVAWIKIRLPHGGAYKGKSYSIGSSLEIKLGSLSSWSWQELEGKHQEMQGKAERGEALEETPDWLFKDWAQDYLNRAKTRVDDFGSLEIHVRKHLNPTFGKKALSTITRSEINRWQGKQLENLAPATVKRQLNTFKAIINDALNSELIEKSPLKKLNPIKGIEGRKRFLTDEELVILLAKAQEVQDWLPDFLLWQVHSGMRKGETIALLWSDILELKDDRVIAQIRMSKSGKGRTVICTKTMKTILEQQKERKKENDERVFPISKMTLRRRWEAARKAASLEDVTIHDVRRTHATHAVVAGVDLRTLAARIGHTDLAMLEKHYAQIVGSAEHEAAEKIQDTFDRLTANVVPIKPGS
jgi:integrase